MSLEHWTIMNGDSLSELKKLERESIQTVVTSPPYWGLRDYGTATWVGGKKDCDHIANPNATKKMGNPEFNENRPSRTETKTKGYYKSICPKCGAGRIDSQLGAENTPDEYVDGLVDVFREIRRVLKKDGTVWLNLGDTYSGTGHKGDLVDPKYTEGRNGQKKALNNKVQGLKPKDLVGIPWRVAFALQADGWYLRSDIIWHKPNSMPEPVQDRPTKSHEYIFLLSKSPHYYYDADAIREPYTVSSWDEGTGHDTYRNRDLRPNDLGRNKRDVWTVNTKSFPEAHFATFPEKLIDTCIKAGTKENDIVLDPFSGAGTTGVVACKLNRRYIGIELNPDYAEMSKNRLAKTVGATEEQALEMESAAVQGFLI